MKTYKQAYQIALAKNSRLCSELNEVQNQSYARKLALEEAKLPDPVRVANYNKTVDCLKNLYYTMNQARPEWELVRNLLADLGEV